RLAPGLLTPSRECGIQSGPNPRGSEDGRRLKFSFFHLMPYTHLELESHEWPFPNRYFDPEKASALYKTYVESMIHAESCGFDWVGCNEHHFSPYGLMANCNLIGAALVYPTSKIRIAMMGNLVPLNNPIRIAEEYAMLDCMSGGRLIAGLMRGIPHEYIAYNIPPDASWSRQREAIALILKAWTEPEPFGWEGEHFQFRQVSIWPRPLQKPHPPLVVSASSLESARFDQDQANRERMQNHLAKREASTMEQQIAGGMILCGSPESVVQQIRRIHAELGHGIFNFTMKVGDLPDAMVRRGMELFRDRV